MTPLVITGCRITRYAFPRGRVIGDSQVRSDMHYVGALELLTDGEHAGLGFFGALFHPLPARSELERVFAAEVFPALQGQNPFVLLNRALLHHEVVAGRTHAQRGVLRVGRENSHRAGAPDLSAAHTRELARLFARLRRSEPASQSRAATLVYLTGIISEYTRGIPEAEPPSRTNH